MTLGNFFDAAKASGNLSGFVEFLKLEKKYEDHILPEEKSEDHSLPEEKSEDHILLEEKSEDHSLPKEKSEVSVISYVLETEEI